MPFIRSPLVHGRMESILVYRGSKMYGKRGRYHRIKTKTETWGRDKKIVVNKEKSWVNMLSLMWVYHFSYRLETQEYWEKNQLSFSTVSSYPERNNLFYCKILYYLPVINLKIYFKPNETSKNKEDKSEYSFWTSRRHSGICHRLSEWSLQAAPWTSCVRPGNLKSLIILEVLFNTLSPVLVGL